MRIAIALMTLLLCRLSAAADGRGPEDPFCIADAEAQESRSHRSRTEQFLRDAERTARARCPEVSELFWAWLNRRPDIRAGLLASHDPVHPGAVRNFFHLGRGLSNDNADRYAHLLLAVAIARKDEDLRAGLSRSPKKALSPELEEAVDKLVLRLRTEKTSLVALVKNQDAIFRELRLKVGKRDRERIWFTVGVRAGVFPERRMPKVADFLRVLIERYETELPEFTDGGPQWPLFPIDKAPWPILMPLAETRPLDECRYVWDHFTGTKLYPEGKKKRQRRIKTYARYSWDYRTPEFQYKKSDWHPKSMPRIVEDGGVCGRLSQLARTTFIALGKPAMAMPQPGHCAVMFFDVTPEGKFVAKTAQSIRPMNVSRVPWPFKDATGWRTIAKNNEVRAEYMYGLAHAMNHGLESFMDSRIAVHLARRLEASQVEQRRYWLEEAVRANPYNVGAWYLLAENAHGDIPRINAIVRNVYRAMGDPGAEVVFEEERTADTDFNEVEESMSVNKSGENAAMTALVVGMSIIEHTYPASLAKKRHLEECLAFLQAETERQQSIRKSPYRHTLYRLTREFEIAVEDLGPVRKKVAEFVLAEIRRTGKRGKLDAGRIEAELDAVLKVMKEGDKRRAWLQRFRDEFDKVYDRRRLFRHDPKKDRVNVDRTYAFIVQKQIDAIRSKGRKFKAEAAKFQEAYKAYIEASVDKAG